MNECGIPVGRDHHSNAKKYGFHYNGKGQPVDGRGHRLDGKDKTLQDWEYESSLSFKIKNGIQNFGTKVYDAAANEAAYVKNKINEWLG